MNHRQMKEIALSIIEKGEVENDYIEYKKSKENSSSIIKTICAYCNIYEKTLWNSFHRDRRNRQ
jgi:predicted HTH transcriptional regulator